MRRGYCYHSALRSYKTETLLEKWRSGWGSAQQRRIIAYELSFRDPALALAEVTAFAAGERKRKKATLLCLHHVADAATARELFDGDGFDPDALHLAAFSALLDDYLAAAPALAAKVAEARLARLGFLDDEVPNPIADGPTGSHAERTSPDRYGRVIVRFLSAVFADGRLAHLRPLLAQHLRSTYAPAAYALLLERWAAGELGAIAAIAGVTRLGYARAREVLGARVEGLIDATIAELAAPAERFEVEALENGWLPGAAKELPEPLAIRLLLGFLDAPRWASQHLAVARRLIAVGEAQRAQVLQRLGGLPGELIFELAASRPYEVARAELSRAGVAPDHPALTRHPGAPADPAALARALEGAPADPGAACAVLARAAGDHRSPERERAFAQLLAHAGRRGDGARRFAIHHLGELGDPRATPVLVEALADDAFAEAHLLVLSALQRAADRRAIPPLQRLLAGGVFPQAVEAALAAIRAR